MADLFLGVVILFFVALFLSICSDPPSIPDDIPEDR